MPEEVVNKVERDKEKTHKAPKKHKTLLNKIVIRRLPPNFNEEQFLISIQPTVLDEFYFVKADLSLGVEATSRAYIEMKSQDEIFLFKDKFDGYVFLDPVRGTEYPAVVEYASFQGLPKSRARKDKHAGTIESEQHFQNFIESLKKLEENDNQKSEGKLEFSFQLKDDKKITSTPLLEFLAAAKEEKREAKKKKIDDKKKQRDEDKQRKKKEVAKNIPEPIKESKEEVVYDDGVIVRTVPSRLGRNESKNVKKDNNDKEALEKERREKREEKKKLNRERDEKRRQERVQQRIKERNAREKANAEKESEIQQASLVTPEESTKPQKREEQSSSKTSQPQPQKREIKRYSELRKARQEKSSGDPKEADEDFPPSAEKDETDKPNESAAEDSRWKKIQEAREKRAQHKEQLKKEKDSKKSNASDKSENHPQEDQEKLEEKPKPANDEDPKWKRIQEMREKRAREKEERAQREREERTARQIRNKDRPSMQIYRPKRVVDGKGDGSNDKSSDEKSESTRKRSDSFKGDRRDRNRKNSRDEKRKKGFGKRGSSNDDETVGVTDDKEQETAEGSQKKDGMCEEIVDENLKLEDNSLEPEDIKIQPEKIESEKIDDDKAESVGKAEEIQVIENLEKLTLDKKEEEEEEEEEVKDLIKEAEDVENA